MRASQQAASLAVLCALGLATTALAADPPSVRLPIPSSLDRAHATRFYHRIEKAAQEVCEPLDSRELARHRAYRRCVEEAVSRAVAQVQSRELTQIHLAQHGGAPRL